MIVCQDNPQQRFDKISRVSLRHILLNITTTRGFNGSRAFLLTVVILLSLPIIVFAGPLHIGIQASPALLNAPPAGPAVNDLLKILRKAFPAATVSLNGNTPDIRIILPDSKIFVKTTEKRRQRTVPFPTLSAPDPSYCWTSGRRAGVTTLHLEATTPEGVCSGIYGLLQEKLGVSFIHPRQTILPSYEKWPLPVTFSFSACPRFENRGYHIHTLHPVELTEQLLNPALPDAFEDVAAYIDWLARNGQNTFQFYLLRGLDREAWIPHARKIVAYAHRRGIRCGVELSLAMIQQQAFQAVTLLRPFPSYRHQVDDTLAWLFQAPWDFITLEATMGEHLPVAGKLLPGVQEYFERQVQGLYGTRLLYATHVIRTEVRESVRRPILPESGILIHTVMCYSASERYAPVYGNVNQRFMLDAAREESRRRETWYWPESSYWVGFDSSVPLLLLTYLDSRWADMNTMEKIGVNGHLTFTSGWEWGYWLVDWSIARWSWRYGGNGQTSVTTPLSCLNGLVPDRELSRLWREALALQNRFLKERELLRYMAALTPFSELPRPFDVPFQPDPPFHYSWLRYEASPEQCAAVLRGPVADLEAYAAGMGQLTSRIAVRIEAVRRSRKMAADRCSVADELNDGLRVTALRAGHRALTLRALIEGRNTAMVNDPENGQRERYLHQAADVRREAIHLVRRQENRYRYPRELLSTRRRSLTAYPFGYLYPVTALFFWKREEEQVRRDRFDPLFMNLWDFRRALGLESLFFRE